MSTVLDNDSFRELLAVYPDRAVKLLNKRFSGTLFYLSFRLTGDEDASKDIVQETLFHVWLNSKELSRGHEKSIEHYLVRVVRNMSISYFKSALQRGLIELRFDNAPIERSNPETEIIEKEVFQEFRDVINSFPKRQKECILLHMDMGWRPEQIAAELGIGKKTVQKSLTAAKKKIKAYFKSKRDEKI